ncbi:MAG: acetoin dehydrogenase dihydrolipoyllysine-residue acetyltransferase subunit [Marinibacterium sp.]
MTSPTRITLRMPRLGETMDAGTITGWLVQPGERFSRGDPLLEVETDKTSVEYPALGDGVLIETHVAPDDVVEVGTPIAVIETADAWDVAQDGDPDIAPEPAGEHSTSPAPETPPRLRATPLARRIAAQNAIGLEQVAGTGRRGRIEAADVRALLTPTLAAHGGAGSAARVYCVHGFAGLGSNWATLRAALTRTGIQSAAPDLPGHGRNPKEAQDVEALVGWLAADLSERKEPVHLVAHSLGAHVAAKAALLDPSNVSCLTLIAPAGCGYRINGAFVSGMAAAPGTGELAHLMRLLGPKAGRLDAEALSDMAKELYGRRLTALAGAMARGDRQIIDTVGPLQRLAGQVPVTAIFGLADRIIPREQVFNLPASVACHMVDCGHMPHWDATDAVAGIIAAR